MQAFPRMLKMLRENSNTKEKREALTYIRSNSKKLESTNAIKEEQYKELCKLVIDAFTNGDSDTQHEAYQTLNVLIQDFRDHNLNLFEAMSQTNRKNRLKILKLLEVVEENAISMVAYDSHAPNFFEACMQSVQPDTMEWITPNACTENIHILLEAENKFLSDEQKLEEETINYALTFLRRLYKVAAITSDHRVQRFDELLMGKIMILAYMGHKRQRGPALKLLQQALTTNVVSHIRSKFPDIWSRYKLTLQSSYCKRMLLLVAACELDWATQWNISIQFLGTDLHRGAGLINNLLSVEEKAFKSTDTIIRRQAFLSWKLLVDNFALDLQELATMRRIKLLCIPLNAKNSKTELIALTKLEVWWHVIVKLYKDITNFVNPVITQFLNFCFGPLGDTPLLSSKFDVVASPGKRFFKTKIVAMDALCQLLVTQQENHTVFSPILEERLPHSISDTVFQECYKSVIHSVGEALLILSQLTDTEMKNRYQLGKVFWINLVSYVQESKMEVKGPMYKDMVLIITELVNHAMGKPFIKHLILDTILFEVSNLSKNFDFQDDTLLRLVLKLIQTSILNDAEKNHYDALKSLLWRCIKSKEEAPYHTNTLEFLKKVFEKLQVSLNTECKDVVVFELWCVLAEVLTKYMEDVQENNEGSAIKHDFVGIESILTFPFIHVPLDDPKQRRDLSKLWKSLYKQFEIQADLTTTVKPNEVLLKIATSLQHCITTKKECYTIVIDCLDILLSTINYKYLLVMDEIPSIFQLILELVITSCDNMGNSECETALKALSAILITVYGHDSQRVMTYLQASKQAIETMLKFESDMMLKEIANMWETFVSIFKGLSKVVTYDVVLLYKEVIIQALNHSNPDIRSQAFSLLEIQNVVNGSVKAVLDEIEKRVKKDQLGEKCESMKIRKELAGRSPKQVKSVGSLLNKMCGNQPKLLVKQNDKNDKKVLLHDTDSQDYVLIKTDLKFDVNRLTEHQKETLKRKRDDIPALYNDLSQSSSQDTQNLQEWFDKKSKLVESTAKTFGKTNDNAMEEILDHDDNKENKLGLMESEVSETTVAVSADTVMMESIEQNRLSPESVQSVNHSIVENQEIMVDDEKMLTISNTKDGKNTIVELPVTSDMKVSQNEVLEENKHLEQNTASNLVAKRLNFESREEFPDDKAYEDQLSPSVLDCGKRRNRNIGAKVSGAPTKLDEVMNSQTDENIAQVGHRTLRTKVIQTKPNNGNKLKSLDALNVKDKSSEENKRGTKRKSASDSESEGSSQRRRKKMINASEIPSDSDSIKSTESDNAIIHLDGITEDGNLSQRTKNEISRLRINMVFDSPLPNRRRSKIHDDNKEINIKRHHSPENKGTRLRSMMDSKVLDVPKKGSRISEKDGKSSGNQHTVRRRSKRSTKQENEKHDVSADVENTKRLLQSKENEAEEAISQDTTDNSVKTSPSVIQSISCTLVDDDKSEKPILSPKSNVPTNGIRNKEFHVSNESIIKSRLIASIEEKVQNRDEVEDIIESSQEFNTTSTLEKKLNEKQCFIKINKIDNIRVLKVQETIAEGNLISNDCLSNFNTEGGEAAKTENKQLIGGTSETTKESNENLSRACVNNHNGDEKHFTSESQKLNDPANLSKSLIGFSSPKSNTKRYSKFRAYSAQGRAAHMLGLVTKQARIETDCQTIHIDDEPATKKIRTKDTDTEICLAKKDRLSLLKELDKVGGACSSRQEKIFSNMRSSDYCSLPSIKLFSNLKNDGEKVSSKVEKSVLDYVNVHDDAQAEKSIDETSSPPLENNELPILEWSSANPPSLTASPSVSILKRHRQSVPEPDPESVTPNKRKRVSFADPPVSREMGYEIASSGSPHKGNKFSTSRGLVSRKDSPLRLKQSRPKLIQIESEKLEKESDIRIENMSEVDLQCERENELLTKIAEELEYSENMSIDVDTHVSSNSEENEPLNDSACKTSTSNKLMITNLALEIEIAENVDTNKRMEKLSPDETYPHEENNKVETVKFSNSDINNIEPEGTETQQDIFSGNDHKDDDVQIFNNKICSADQLPPIHNSTLESPKFNVTNDSIIDILPQKGINRESLEDTVDAENLTGLNSTANSDEIFCGKLIRTSTQAAENTDEQDTLPVTDSVFGSLPLSQDSQSESQFSVGLPQPELLDSTLPIYPALTSCSAPIKPIISQLTNPLWVQHLTAYFVNRGLQTIGELAQLTEREVNRIPVKGNSKVEFVKSVLKCYENTNTADSLISMSQELCNAKESHNEANNSVNNIVSSCKKLISEDAETRRSTVQSKLGADNLQLIQSNDSKALNKSTVCNKRSSVTTDNLFEYNLIKSPRCMQVDEESIHQNLGSPPHVNVSSSLPDTFEQFATEINSTSVVNALSSNSSKTIMTRVEDKLISTKMSVVESEITPKIIDQSVTNCTPCITKSVGTCTDPMVPAKAFVKKASKSVASQMELEDLLDEIDVNLVLESAVRRCTPEKILAQYKTKMRHVPESELEKETIKMLGMETKLNYSEVTLKSACRACGVNKVLLRLPDIFSADKQFFVKVLNTYRKKIKINDCLNVLEFDEVKEAVCQKCTSSELAEMLSKKLKDEEQEGIRKPMTELSSLNAMLKRMPMDVIISHTVANDEVIPSRLVLDIALQNNSPQDIAQALESQSPIITQNVFNKLWSPELVAEHIEKIGESKEGLLNIFKAVSSQLNTQELLNVYYESMQNKITLDMQKE